jgi:CheY-like chemotaxis protein
MEGKYSQAPTPALLLLDMNMPLMDGREVLAEMAADKTPNAISVIVLTPSAEDEEILKMYKLRSRSYIIKPLDFDDSLIPTLLASLLLQRARPRPKVQTRPGRGRQFFPHGITRQMEKRDRRAIVAAGSMSLIS